MYGAGTAGAGGNDVMVSSVMVFAGKNGYGFPSGGGRYRIGMDIPAITGYRHAQAVFGEAIFC